MPLAAAPRTWVVDQRNRGASDTGPGTAARPFRTISAAAARAGAGDTVLVHGGIYRERVSPARGGVEGSPITYQAAPGEPVVVRGSEVWKPAWKSEPGHSGVFFGALDPAMFGDFNPYRTRIIDRKEPARPALGPRFPRTLGQVFQGGHPLREVETMEDLYRFPGTWIVSGRGDGICVHFPGAPSELEISVRNRIFAPHLRGLGYIHVRGFTFEHCANQFPWPQMGALGTRSGHHWIIEDNVVRYARTIGMDIGSEGTERMPDAEGNQPRPEVVGYHLIRRNTVTDNGLSGIAGIIQVGTRIVGNIVERNNAAGFKRGEGGGEQGGIKVHDFYYGLIEGNLVRDNDWFGIWLDRAWDHSRVTRNLLINNLTNGIKAELGHGPVLIDDNVIAYTRDGDGVVAVDASGLTVAHNLIWGNAGFGVSMVLVTDRAYGGHYQKGRLMEASRESIRNNIFVDNGAGAINLPFPFARAHDNHADGNLYASAELQRPPLFVYNTSRNRVQPEELAAAFRKAVPAAGQPNWTRWLEFPYFTLDEWRQVSGNDLGSRTEELNRPMLRSRLADIEITVDETLWKVVCRSVDGVDRDYFGNPFATPLPGPFQKLQKGYNRFLLWPPAAE